MLGAYSNGWLSFLEAPAVVRIVEGINRMARPIMLLTLLLECGSLVMLWRRWSFVAFIVLATSFHLGVLAMTGIFFWKWILADGCLLAFVLHRSRGAVSPFFTPARFALSVVVILASPLWVKAENLTWFDTPLTYSLRFEGVDASGRVHPLPAGFFRPYTDAIVLGTFAQVSPQVQLTRGMAVTLDRGLAEALERSRTPEEVYALEARLGSIRLDTAAVAAFDEFVGRYAANAGCDEEREPTFLRLFGAPRHLWTSPLDATLPCDSPLATVRVFEETSFFDGAQLSVIRRRLLREVPAARRAR